MQVVLRIAWARYVNIKDEDKSLVDVKQHESQRTRRKPLCHLTGTLSSTIKQVHPNETKELIAVKLREFDEELAGIPAEKMMALLQAQEKCPELLTDKFKLMFLRAMVFNVDLAVARYIKYWEKRLQTFGPVKAFQPLTLDRALCDDNEAIGHGLMRDVGTRDPMGRSICYIDLSALDLERTTRESIVRAVWYMVHAGLEDESTQKYGGVSFVNLRNVTFTQMDLRLAKTIQETLTGALPLRVTAIHIFHPPKVFAVIFPIVKGWIPEVVRNRLILHSGSDEKVRAGMKKYGFTEKDVPEGLGGSAVVNYDKWLEQRRSSGL
jgi:CRAL/TRIO domain